MDKKWWAEFASQAATCQPLLYRAEQCVRIFLRTVALSDHPACRNSSACNHRLERGGGCFKLMKHFFGLMVHVCCKHKCCIIHT